MGPLGMKPNDYPSGFSHNSFQRCHDRAATKQSQSLKTTSPPASTKAFLFFDIPAAARHRRMADGVKVDKYPSPSQRMGQLLTNFTKFAIDSAVDASFKGATGWKVYKIVQERLMPQSASLTLNDEKKCHDIGSPNEMKAKKMEEMQEDMGNLKQLHQTSGAVLQGSNSQKKMPNEGVKTSNIPEPTKKRVFIRSRL